MTHHNLRHWEKLLFKFQKITKTKDILPSYIEIAGYPNYENVASNILAFYLDNHQKHQLGNLLLKSLLSCLPNVEVNKLSLEVISVYREFVVEDQKRIDIVVECDDFCVSIENKIFHHLHNDLALYERSINKKFSNPQNYHIVLGIKKEKVRGQFLSITYAEFFDKIKSNLGFYALEGNKMYITYLLDFMQTIENHYKVDDINKEMFRFLIDNKQEIQEIIEEKQKVNIVLQRFIKQFSEKIGSNFPNLDKSWIYAKYVIVFDFIINGSKIAVDINFDVDRVTMDLFGREPKGVELVHQLNLIKNNNFPDNYRGKEIFQKDVCFIDINEEELISEITNYLNKIYID